MTEQIIRSTLDAIERLLITMDTLRSPLGCAWDRQQTPESLKRYILEEAYEVIEAIDRGAPSEVCEELGDLLLQVVFQAQIYREEGAFGMMEVANSINEKLLRRHPHIFADAAAEDSDANWERIKAEELKEKGQSMRLNDRIPQALPALKRAEKLVHTLTQTRRVLRDDDVPCSLPTTKILTQTNQQESRTEITEQLIGDALFELAALAKSHGVDAEDSLRLSIDRRIKDYDKEVIRVSSKQTTRLNTEI